MKKLWNSYFRVPSEGKIPDRVMTAWAVLTLLLILLYLAAMAFAAYAFYTYEGTVSSSLFHGLGQLDMIWLF